MGEHRDLTGTRVREVTKNGVDPAARRSVIVGIVALGLVAALLWTALLMRDVAANTIPGTVMPRQHTVEYNSQGWPIITDAYGNQIHPEDMGR